jgi:hypothetical protein
MTKGRWITDDGIDGEWLASHRVRSKGRLPETIEHGSSHFSLRPDIAVSQCLPGGKQTGIWMSAFFASQFSYRLTLDHVRHQLLRTTTNIKVLQKTVQLSSIFTGLALESLVAVEYEVLEVGMCGDPHSVRVRLDKV